MSNEKVYQKSNQEDELILIPPRAKKTIYALSRSSGYDFYTAVQELIDNSIDAFLYSLPGDKNIKILYHKYSKKGKFVIADTGSGMTLITLKEALTIGSEINKDLATDLGYFGMGLNTGAMAIGTKITVITKEEDGDYVKAIFDINEVTKTDKWILKVSPLKSSDYDLINLIFPSFKHGTFVIIDNLRFKDTNPSQKSSTLRKKIGKSFFRMINAGINIKINRVDC